MRILMTSLLVLMFVTAAHAADFVLTSTAFRNHENMPALYSCNGKNISPPLHWENPPAKTQSYALIVSSPYWVQNVVYKWVVYNLPSTLAELKPGANNDLPAGALAGMNSFDDAIYRGPCPPDAKVREYIFTLYALDTMLTLDEKADVEDVFEHMRHHILKQTQLTGIFQH
jgi:Raf kinase inhibitor-like YbhB/YbcL family protein